MSQLRGRALPVRQSQSPSRKLAHLAVIAQLALQSQPAFTQRALASFLSLHPSTPPPATPNPRLLACFLSLSRKGDPLYSSEIKTGRCKLQINVIKCLRYHKPSHRSGWLAGWLAGFTSPLLPPHQHGLAAPSLCLSVEADRWRRWGDVQSFWTCRPFRPAPTRKTTLSGYR